MRVADAHTPLELDLGGRLSPIDVVFETYGSLSSNRDNAILVTHALAAGAHAAGWDEATGRLGWWDDVIGPGKAIDTDRFFVICPNVLGSCHGTTGPASIDPVTEKPYGLGFPKITTGDWVATHARLLDALGIERVYAVVGGSLGGQQALEMALRFPHRVERAVILAAAGRLSAQGLAFNAVGRASIFNDPDFQGGDYYGGKGPIAGLSAARMMAHITYLSDEIMGQAFGRRFQEGLPGPGAGFGAEFAVENYLADQGRSFAERFDANSYLYITRAMDYYDAAAWGDGDLVRACARIAAEVLILSFDSDWLYPPKACRELAVAIIKNGRQVTYANEASPHGHDSFLFPSPTMNSLLNGFLSY